MARFSTNMMMVMACMSLSACTTSENWIPLAEVGGGSSHRGSAPVTQPDAQQMADTVSRQPFPATEESTSLVSAYQARSTGAAPTSLEAQAEAIDKGERSPAASVPFVSENQEQGTSFTSNAQAEEEDMARAAPPQPETATETAPAQAPVASAEPIERGNSLRFLPIIGAPVEAVTPLSRQLGAEARAHGLSIKSSTDASSDYILKGYLSAFNDGGSLTVVYVWDVLDKNGNRLHRLQGQKTAPATAASDPWDGVSAPMMQDIASKTMDEFTRWRTSQGG